MDKSWQLISHANSDRQKQLASAQIHACNAFIPTLGNGFPSEAVLKRRPRVSLKSVRDGTMMIDSIIKPPMPWSQWTWLVLSVSNESDCSTRGTIHSWYPWRAGGATEADKMVNPSCKGIKYSSKRPTWTHKTAGWEVWFQVMRAVSAEKGPYYLILVSLKLSCYLLSGSSSWGPF